MKATILQGRMLLEPETEEERDAVAALGKIRRAPVTLVLDRPGRRSAAVKVELSFAEQSPWIPIEEPPAEGQPVVLMCPAANYHGPPTEKPKPYVPTFYAGEWPMAEHLYGPLPTHWTPIPDDLPELPGSRPKGKE